MVSKRHREILCLLSLWSASPTHALPAGLQGDLSRWFIAAFSRLVILGYAADPHDKTPGRLIDALKQRLIDIFLQVGVKHFPFITNGSYRE